MHALLGLLAILAVTSTDEVYPIRIGLEHASVAWTVTWRDEETSCRVRAWIGRMGEQPLTNLFAVELEGSVAPTAEGETPLYGLLPGTYDLHVENAGCAAGSGVGVDGPREALRPCSL
jgi:hypothetical protein